MTTGCEFRISGSMIFVSSKILEFIVKTFEDWTSLCLKTVYISVFSKAPQEMSKGKRI
jgi:hypothetical protein